MLERVPTIMSAQELLDKAFQRAAKIEIQDPVKYHKVRKEMAGRIQSTSDTLAESLNKYHNAFPNLDRVRTYEAEILDILVGLGPLRQSLDRVHWAKDKVRDLAHEHSDRGRRLRSIEDWHSLLKRHYGRVSSVLYDIDDALTFLRTTRDRMRILPTVSPDYATVVVAGFPNVGKSSLLRAWTESKAEINSYPFTTKQAEVGHFEVRSDQGVPTRVQVVDTPGLLDRPDDERNPVERHAVAALRHTADAVLFLIDPSETSGYSLEEQDRLREQVERELAGLPFMVAETKNDILKRDGAVSFSTATGDGLEALMHAVIAMLPVTEEEPELEVDPLEAWGVSDPDS